MMPILPGITDHPKQVEELVKGATEAGARFVMGGYLHVREPLKDHVLEWIDQDYPHLSRFYRHTYGTRSYAPPVMRRRLGGLIGRSKAAHGAPARNVDRPAMREPGSNPTPS